ncbi:MAG TPA: YraN family protein [Bacteroidales bacterium]|nr:YraN family protein [Bacteroidales bacterium]
MAEHNNIGKIGEDIAADFLLKKGYKILERNWRVGQYEIDIIAQDGNVIVIVEVKTLKSNNVITPEAIVGKQKQKNLIKAANIYMDYKNLSFEIRFDIVAILLKNNNSYINYIPDAFYPTINH